jgi:hypothetical protein
MRLQMRERSYRISTGSSGSIGQAKMTWVSHLNLHNRGQLLTSRSRHLAFARFPHYENAVSRDLAAVGEYFLGNTNR